MRSRTRGGSRRASVARRRSWASASAWNVPAVTAVSTPSASSRSTSSPAARRVKVTASTWRASASCSRTRNAIRRVSTRVLPDPAGAQDRQRRVRFGDGRRAGARRDRRAIESRHARARPYRSAETAVRTAAVPTRGGRNGKAPSSLRCVAAPISSGPVPRPPLLNAGKPSRAPTSLLGRCPRAASKGPARPAARAPVPTPPGGRSGVGAAANRQERQYDRGRRGSSGICPWNSRNCRTGCSVEFRTKISRRHATRVTDANVTSREQSGQAC